MLGSNDSIPDMLERSNMKRQTGASLMETMIALALSTIVISGMVVLMGNSMGTSNRIMQMSQLTDQLRNVMSIMTRDVRRANYSAASILCYGFAGCSEYGSTLQLGSGAVVVDEDNPAFISASGTEGDIILVETADGPCMLFQLDRLRSGSAIDDSKGGFRRKVHNINGRNIGVMEMWVHGGGSVPDCFADAGATDDDGNGWLAVSDPNAIDITDFVARDITDEDEVSPLSAEKSILQNGGTKSYTQRQRQLRLAVEGQLLLESSIAANDPALIRRRVADIIRVRNDFLSPPVDVAAP